MRANCSDAEDHGRLLLENLSVGPSPQEEDLLISSGRFIGAYRQRARRGLREPENEEVGANRCLPGKDNERETVRLPDAVDNGLQIGLLLGRQVGIEV